MRLRVTLADIAAECGVGKSTVARALSNFPHVRKELRKKIRAKAKEMGYRSDPGLRVLSQHRWRKASDSGLTVAIVNTSARSPKAIQQEAKARVQQLGYRLDTFNLWDYPSARSLGKTMFNRGIRGLIIPAIVDKVGVPDFDWSLFSAVGCSIGEYRLPIHSVSVNHFDAVRLCWRQCASRGYRRIGAALYRQEGPDQNDAPRHAAFAYERDRASQNFARIPIHAGSMSDRDAFLKWYFEYRPDAVIALNDLAYWWLIDAGVKVPGETGFCSSSRNSDSPDPCCGASNMNARIAEICVNWIDQLIRINETGLPQTPEEILVTASWIEGSTLPRAKVFPCSGKL